MTNKNQMIDIVSSIYDTILNPDAWALTGQKIRERYHSVYAGLYVYDTRTSAMVHDGTYGGDEAFVNLYFNEFCFLDPYRESEKFIAENPNIPLTDPYIDEIFFSVERNHKQHKYFGEYWHRYDCQHAIGTMIDLPGHLRAGICAPRSSSIGAYTLEEKHEFEYIRKSFHQAMTISKYFDQLGKNASALEQSINLIDIPVFIVDQNCRILTTNCAGDVHLAKKDILVNLNGMLITTHKKLNKLLPSAISNACNEAISENQPLSTKYVNGPLEILVSPIQRNAEKISLGGERAVVFLFEGYVSKTHVLTEIYHLSVVEHNVLDLVLKGYHISQIANKRGTSTETIKTQLRSIYTKTGSTCMSDLRSKVTSSIIY